MTITPFRVPLSIALALLLPGCTTWRPLSGDTAGFIEASRPDAVLIRTTEGSSIVAYHPIVVDSTVMGSLDLCSRLGATTQQECDQARVPLVHLREIGSVDVRTMSWDSPMGEFVGEAMAAVLLAPLGAALSPDLSIPLSWPKTGPGR